MFDVVCIGPVSIDLYSLQMGAPLEDASTFERFVGGSSANVAIGAARLGLKTAVLSQVGDEPMGRFIFRRLRKAGVDTSLLRQDPTRQTPLVLHGVIPPDDFPSLEYSENSSYNGLFAEDIHIGALEGTKCVVLSGSLLFYERTFKMAQKLVENINTKFILDIDHNGCGNASDGLIVQRFCELIPNCHVITSNEKGLMAITEQANVGSALAFIRGESDAVIIQKRSEEGCIAYPETLDKPVSVDTIPVKATHPLGAGDAFLSAYIYGYLNQLPVQKCCQLGNANGALVATRQGFSHAMPYLEELYAFIEDPEDLERVDHLHRVLGRKRDTRRHCILSLGHRIFFDELEVDASSTQEEIAKFKELVFQGLRVCAEKCEDYRLGIILDEHYGKSLIHEAVADDHFLVSQRIEEPGAYPLAFIHDQEASKILPSWPRKVEVSVLVYVTDNEADQAVQMKRLHDLSRAAEITGHEFFIELAFHEQQETLEGVLRFIEKCYASKIFPTWWNLPAVNDEMGWKQIEKVIRENDPYCFGILLMSHGSDPSHAPELLSQVIPKSEMIRGFNIGRTVWEEAALKWLQGEFDDEQVVYTVAEQFNRLIESCYLEPVE